MKGTLTILKRRKAVIKKVVFQKNNSYLKFDRMDKISFYPQEGFNRQEEFSIHLLNAMNCRSYEQLIGKQIIYYIAKKEDTVFFAVEDPESEGVAYVKIPKKGLFLRKIGLK